MQSSTLTFPVTDDGASSVRRAVAVLTTDGYTMQATSDQTAIGVKRVIPTWAIVLAVIFSALCLVGLLFLLVRQEREVRVTLVSDGAGRRLVVTGMLSSRVLQRLQGELGRPASQGGVAPQPPSSSTRPPAPEHAAPGTPAPVGVAAPPAAAPAGITPPPGSSAQAWGIEAVDPAESPLVGREDAATRPPGNEGEDPGLTVARPLHVSDRVPSARPTIRFEDGTVIQVDGVVMLGRDPATGPGERVDRLLALGDDARELSKTHASLRADGTNLWVVDRHSTNGTHRAPRGGTEAACPPGVEIAVAVGDSVRIGGRQFVRVT